MLWTCSGVAGARPTSTRPQQRARARALAAGHRQIEFMVASDEALPDHPAFDAAIGRYVLHHQADPVAMIRWAATVVRHRSLVVFHESAGHISGHSLPTLDL